MSDSDDTDVLLLIPPDFFLVHSSDSEDSIGQEKYTDKRDFESLVVNDLISQVNELESRISVIENNSLDALRSSWERSHLRHPLASSPTVDSSISQPLRYRDFPLKSHSMLAGGQKFGGSSDNIKSYQIVNNGLNSTPVKQKQSLSLPSTPSVDILGHSNQICSNNQNTDNDTSTRTKNAITIERMTPSEISSMSHPVLDKNTPANRPAASHNQQSQQQRNSSLLGEIDQFLENVVKNANPQHYVSLRNENEHNQKEKPYLCGENASSAPDYGFGVRDFNNLPVREEPVMAKYIAPLEKNVPKIAKRFQPNEVGQFLRDIGDDSKDVDHPEAPNQQRKLYSCGENENSVPDLGFGLKAFSSLPVREETIKQKKVTPLQSYTMTPEIKGLELSDIEKLLKTMEATQYEIEKKLQLREALLGKSSKEINVTEKISALGDTIDSVPDRGFGIRNILYSTKPATVPIMPSADATRPTGDGKKLPIYEEPCTKRSICLLGSDVPVYNKKETQISDNYSQSNQSDNTEIEHSEPQHTNSAVQDQTTKTPLAKRKLELGGDAATIPDLGFGLKSWYQSNQKIQPQPQTILQNVVGNDCTQFSNNQRPVDYATASKNTYLQGDYMPSVPDLGFGLQSLWGNDRPLGTITNSQIPKHSYSVPQIEQTSRNVNTMEYSVLSQIEPPDSVGDNSSVRDVHQSQGQTDRQAGTSVTEAATKKKVDFTVGSGRGGTDNKIVEQDYGSGQHINEGARSRLELQNSFPDSGLATSVSSGSGNLLSLSELWGKENYHNSLPRDEHAKSRLKLEEERYRRQHCEILIHQLQSRLLEEQQKLAVAVQVDKGKDQAIFQLQGAWNRLVQHWKELEEHRHNLASKLQNERETNQILEAERVQKMKQLESELSKALDLAQGYKEKYDTIEKEKLDLMEGHKAEMKKMMDKIKDVEKKLDKAEQIHNHLIREKNEYVEKVNLAEQAAQRDVKKLNGKTSEMDSSCKEKERKVHYNIVRKYLPERKLLIDAQKELENMHKKIHAFEAEMSALKEEKEMVQLKLKEEKGRIEILDQQKKSIQTVLDESKKKEKVLRDEVKQLSGQVDKVKAELREYYQEQLDVVVTEKLREFQEQLDAAETGLHKELEQREHAITEIASKQVKQISEKHKMEVQLLEEKHSEELQLYKLQLAQAMQQITQLESKLQGYNSRKSEIVEKLHGIMETQWKEALRIINGNSPLVNNGSDHSKSQKQENFSKIPIQTSPLTSRQPSGLSKTGIVHNPKTMYRVENESEVWGPSKEKMLKADMLLTSTPYSLPVASNAESFTYKDAAQFRVPPIHLRDQSASSSTADESPFCQEGRFTARLAEQPTSLQETPRNQTSLQTNYENELKRYIMMLLNRAPGNPVFDEMETCHQSGSQSENKIPDGFIRIERKKECSEVPTNETGDFPKWEKILKQESSLYNVQSARQQNMPPVSAYESSKTSPTSTKDGRHMKAPWK